MGHAHFRKTFILPREGLASNFAGGTRLSPPQAGAPAARAEACCTSLSALCGGAARNIPAASGAGAELVAASGRRRRRRRRAWARSASADSTSDATTSSATTTDSIVCAAVSATAACSGGGFAIRPCTSATWVTSALTPLSMMPLSCATGMSTSTLRHGKVSAIFAAWVNSAPPRDTARMESSACRSDTSASRREAPTHSVSARRSSASRRRSLETAAKGFFGASSKSARGMRRGSRRRTQHSELHAASRSAKAMLAPAPQMDEVECVWQRDDTASKISSCTTSSNAARRLSPTQSGSARRSSASPRRCWKRSDNVSSAAAELTAPGRGLADAGTFGAIRLRKQHTSMHADSSSATPTPAAAPAIVPADSVLGGDVGIDGGIVGSSGGGGGIRRVGSTIGPGGRRASRVGDAIAACSSVPKPVPLPCVDAVMVTTADSTGGELSKVLMPTAAPAAGTAEAMRPATAIAAEASMPKPCTRRACVATAGVSAIVLRRCNRLAGAAEPTLVSATLCSPDSASDSASAASSAASNAAVSA